ncbi:MAG: hypothetical protein ACI9G1_002937, partial [Pirellulaceae bacterium]
MASPYEESLFRESEETQFQTVSCRQSVGDWGGSLPS